MAKKAVITKTPSVGFNNPKANLVKSSFDNLIYQQGYSVLKETGLQCPCKSLNSNQQSNCKNCGGSGWLFVNPIATRMILHSMNLQTKYLQWSEQNAGTISISAVSDDQLGFMDRITVLDGQAIFWEVLFLKTIEGADESISESESWSDSVPGHTVYYFSTIYPIKEIFYLAIFNGTQNKLIPLKYGVDFTYKDNKIKFLTAQNWIDRNVTEQDNVTVTIKYMYAPMYHVIDIPRENIQTNEKFGVLDTETVTNLPIHGVGRRAHYQLDAQNYDGTRVFDNSHIFKYEDLNPPKETC